GGRYQRLGRGASVLAAAGHLEQVRARRLAPAHALGAARDARVVRDLGEVGGKPPAIAVGRLSRVVTLLSEIADQRLDDAQAVPGRALDVVRRICEQTIDGRADGSVTEQRDRYVNRPHEPPLSPPAR